MTYDHESPVLDAVTARATRPGVRDGYLTIGSSASRDLASAALRRGLALLDCSWFGKIALAGPAPLRAAAHLALEDVSTLPVDRLVSTLLVHDDGAPLCRALVVNEGDRCLLLTEGARVADVVERVTREVTAPAVADLTDELALVGVAGPLATELLRALAGDEIAAAAPRSAVRTTALAGRTVTLYRTSPSGGGDGWLLLVHAEAAPGLWRALAAAGASRGLVECGFEDLDRCRLEGGVVTTRWSPPVGAKAMAG
jgi:aminomethyltransferase